MCTHNKLNWIMNTLNNTTTHPPTPADMLNTMVNKFKSQHLEDHGKLVPKLPMSSYSHAQQGKSLLGLNMWHDRNVLHCTASQHLPYYHLISYSIVSYCLGSYYIESYHINWDSTIRSNFISNSYRSIAHSVVLLNI